MNIIIYNIYSFGGNYEYAKCIFEAYCNHPDTHICTMLMPSNSLMTGPSIKKILLPDVTVSNCKPYKKLYYIYRSIINPLKLFRYLTKQEASVVLFNDFDQHTAPIWVPLFFLLKKKHRFGVYLHDPDRDAFFSILALSRFTMQIIMSFMDIALYHSYLPNKSYYKRNFVKIKVPHGIYNNIEVDQNFMDQIVAVTKGHPVIGAIGNIRDEKNYELLIDAICFTKNVYLLIAGQPANSNISIEPYKEYAKMRNVADRIIWIIGYLPQNIFNAAIKSCEIILLCYKSSFTSQSGILNSIAHFHKKIIITDTKSSLKDSVFLYELGEIIPNGNISALVSAIEKLLIMHPKNFHKNWQTYISDSNWGKHVNIAIHTFNDLK